MGLDINFHESVEYQPPHATEWVDADGTRRLCDHQETYTSGRFPRTEREITSGLHYEDTGRTHSWHASYRGYSMFRACILHTVRPDLVTRGSSGYPGLWELSDDEFHGMPFNELIWFSDCEGTYGPQVAAKLLKDFRDHEHLIEASSEAMFPGMPNGGFAPLYREYMTGLELVGERGLVDYH